MGRFPPSPTDHRRSAHPCATRGGGLFMDTFPDLHEIRAIWSHPQDYQRASEVSTGPGLPVRGSGMRAQRAHRAGRRRDAASPRRAARHGRSNSGFRPTFARAGDHVQVQQCCSIHLTGMDAVEACGSRPLVKSMRAGGGPRGGDHRVQLARIDAEHFGRIFEPFHDRPTDLHGAVHLAQIGRDHAGASGQGNRRRATFASLCRWPAE